MFHVMYQVLVQRVVTEKSDEVVGL